MVGIPMLVLIMQAADQIFIRQITHPPSQGKIALPPEGI
jgi:hypothetical protein